MAESVIKKTKIVSYVTTVTTDRDGYAYIDDDVISIHASGGFLYPFLLMPRALSNGNIRMFFKYFYEDTTLKSLSSNTSYDVTCFKYS